MFCFNCFFFLLSDSEANMSCEIATDCSADLSLLMLACYDVLFSLSELLGRSNMPNLCLMLYWKPFDLQRECVVYTKMMIL